MMPNDNVKTYMIKDMIVYISLERWAWKDKGMWGSVMGISKEEVALVKL